MKKMLSNKNKIIRIGFSLVLIGILCVPMLYALTYLGGVWDVYNHLNTVPVAFVNRDQSFSKDGKIYDVGNEIESSLKDNQKVSWNFVSEEDAMNGINQGSYYAIVEIPDDFSQEIADAQDGNFQNPEIKYIANQGSNFVFSQMSSKIATGIKEAVNENIQEEVTKSLVENMDEIKTSLGIAADSAVQIKSGTQVLLTANKQLSDGIGSATYGAGELHSGLQTAVNATNNLQVGTQQLLLSSGQLANGLGAVQSGSQRLLQGLQSIADGQSKVTSGSSALVVGLTTLKTELTTSDAQIPQLVQGANTISSQAEATAQGAQQLSTSLATVAMGISQATALLESEMSAIADSNMSQQDKNELASTITALYNTSNQQTADGSAPPLRKVADSMQQLSDGIQSLSIGSQKVSSGISSLVTGITNTQSKAAAGVDQLTLGAQTLKDSSNALLSGLNTMSSQTVNLVNGLSVLNDGAFSLENGIGQVNDGSMELSGGIKLASDETDKLADGLTTLYDGTNKLSGGLETAENGVGALSDGINKGFGQLDRKLTFSSTDMAKFVSQPVSLSDQSINKVDFYGEGLAPYFISMSIWLGSMFISIIITITKKRKICAGGRLANVLNRFWGGFFIGSILVAIQALILSIVLPKVLNFEPVYQVLFYLLNMLIGVAFFSVMYGVSYAFGLFGSIIMFVLLLLQLSSSGGTFPIQTAPLFYRMVNKFLPMTYSISILRMNMSGANESVMRNDIVIMLLFVLLFLVGGYLIRRATNLIRKIKERNISTISQIEKFNEVSDLIDIDN